MRPLLLAATLLSLAACSSPPPEPKPVAKAEPYGPGPAAATGKNPLAKYIELGGVRLSEVAGKKLQVKFIAVNHSDADLEELKVHVRLTTSTAKPGDEPVAQFDATIPGLGPQEERQIIATTTTKLRVYEMPDWQFLRADFDIVSPAQ